MVPNRLIITCTYQSENLKKKLLKEKGEGCDFIIFFLN